MTNKTVDTGITVAVRLLELINASSDVFPPLKSASGGALYIAQLIGGFRLNKKEWAQFLEHVQLNVALIAQSIANQATQIPPASSMGVSAGNIDALEDLNKVLHDVQSTIEAMQGCSLVKRVLSYVKDQKQIEGMEKGLARVSARFHLQRELQISRDTEKTIMDLCAIKLFLDDVNKAIAVVDNKVSETHAMVGNVEAMVDGIEAGIQTVSLASPLSKLPYAEGASWDIGKICQEGTRVPVVAEIMDFVGNFQADGSARVFCLTGAPGTGKTTIAHSISKLCHDAGWLATAFFFNREDSTRAPKLFSTIAYDLAARFPRFRASISQAIKQDPSLASASLTHQFYKLIKPFCHLLPQDRPIVIVLDALDEGYCDALLEFLVKNIAFIPGVLQIVATTRDVVQMQLLLVAPHVHHRAFHHNLGSNLNDVEKVVQVELSKVALKKGLLGTGWPTVDHEILMKEKSGGLMIWVTAVCQYLSQPENLDPKGELESLLQSTSSESLEAEAQMDLLYVAILRHWNWSKRGFTEDYKQVMGAILVSKIPLSVQAIDLLYSGKTKIKMLLPLLRPLLLQSEENQFIQILHQSLHDFLTGRAHLANDWKVFAVDEREHNEILAIKTICVINIELSIAIPGTGYIGQMRGMPKISENIVPEHISYACRFWMEHLKEIREPCRELVDALSFFLSTKLVLWLELSACMWQNVAIESLLTWINVRFPSPCMSECFTDMRQMFALIHFSNAQTNMGMRKDALETIKAAVAMQRELANANPAVFNSALALSLGNLSNQLSDMGAKDDALLAIKESVSMRRKLVQGNSVAFNAELARSLGNLSNRLSDVGSKYEALQAIREAVALRRVLAKGKPSAFNAELARSLANLSNHLIEMGVRDEALDMIREAVAMQRDLVKINPFAFNADLARSLRNLSNCLSEMGTSGEALDTIKEAVQMQRELAKKNPAAFNADLASSLGSLSNCFSNLGAKSEALQAIREAVEMRRGLSKENNGAFNADLAWSLGTLSNCLSNMGTITEALQAIREAVEIRRQLAKENTSATSNANLADALCHLSCFYSEMGHTEDAFQTVEEAVLIFRGLMTTNP
ncbi:TPR-like protein, partial [Schizopora paradoxa]